MNVVLGSRTSTETDDEAEEIAEDAETSETPRPKRVFHLKFEVGGANVM